MNLAEAITYLRPIAESATVGHYAEALGMVLATAALRRPAQTEPADDEREALTGRKRVMATEALKYRKKPVEIEAMRWDGTAEGATPIIEWSGWDVNYWCDEGGCGGTEGNHYLAIPTLEGRMLASPGDWIIKGVQGEFYPCKPDIFEQTYEVV